METSFFSDLSIVIAVAAAVGVIFSRWNLPLTVGYILAGVIIGPFVGPAWIRDEANIRMLSDLGVMFLMFSIGLGFSFRRVRTMGSAVIFPAVLDVTLMVIGGFFLGRLLGWGNLECFLLGMILCDSSTSIAAKTLESLGWLGQRFADRTFAIALLEDILAILLVAILNGVTGADAGSGVWETIGIVIRQMGVLLLFLVGVIVLGLLFVPRLMNAICLKMGDEMVLMVSLGLCCGIACLAQEALGLSLVVGAFLAGAVVAESRYRRRIERTVKPVTNLFAAVFFVSVGLVVRPLILWENLGSVLLITGAMIVFKLINLFVACVLMGSTPRDAFKIGLGMGQVAEFSFIIAGIAMTRGLSDKPLYQIAVGVALLCTATNPYLLKYSDKLYEKMAHVSGRPFKELLQWYQTWLSTLQLQHTRNGQTLAAQLRHHAILILLDLTLIAVAFTVVYGIAHIPGVQEILLHLNKLSGHFPVAGALASITALLLSSPMIWATLHAWGQMIRCMTENHPQTSTHRLLLPVRQYARSILRLLGYGVMFFYLAFMCGGFLNNIWIVFVVLLTAATYVGTRWRRLQRGYYRVHRTLTRAFDVDLIPSEAQESIDTLMKVHTETVVIPPESAIIGKTLAEINLRHITGVSVISMYNGLSTSQISPGGDMVVNVGDTLVICGSDAELSRALQLLTVPPVEPDRETLTL